MTSYRRSWSALLSLASEVVVFSNSSRELLLSAFSFLHNVVVRPHKVDLISIHERTRKFSSSLTTIGIVGNLTVHKGLNVVRDLVAYSDVNGLPVKFVLIGEPDEPISSSRFFATGPYSKTDLASLLGKYSPDVVFFPSVWPETFSYVCSELMGADMPFVAFDLGAQGEKADSFEKGATVPLDITAEELISVLINHAKRF